MGRETGYAREKSHPQTGGLLQGESLKVVNMLDLARELSGAPEPESPPPAHPINPADFWRRKFAGWTAPTPLVATIPPAPDASGAGRCSRQISESAVTRLNAFAKQLGVPLNTVFVGAWALLLHRYSGEDDVVFGLVKGCLEAGGENDSVTPHIVPVRVLFQENARVGSWLRALAEQGREAEPFQFSTLPQIRAAAGITPGTPMFHTVVSIANDAFDPASVIAAPDRQENFPLAVATYLGSDAALHAAFDEKVFSEAAGELLLGHWASLIENMIAAPDELLSAVPMITSQERAQVLEGWNATAAPYPAGLCIQQLFEAQVERSSDATALVFGERTLSYRDLNHRANTLAHHLRALGVGADNVVGICMERSIEAVVAVLGVLKAGGAYVPLDPNYPQERLQFMLADARARVLLTQPQLEGIFAALPPHVIHLNDEWFANATASPENPTVVTAPENLAYLIYTSGSTGKPKGVAMIHRALVNLIDWQTKQSPLGVGDKTLQFTSLSFDVSFQELFSTWCSGGALVLITADLRLSPRDLWNFIVRENITRIFLPFVALQQLAEAAAHERTFASTLREVITAGEQLQVTPKLRDLFERHPQAKLHNHYGPSETHVVTALELDGAPQNWPALPSIGRPIQNAAIYLLDKHLAPVPLGIAGELYIGGAALARGYFERADVTAERFVANPFEPGARLYRTGDLARWLPNGEIEFLGRIDHQVKIRGYRVELGEIESAINKLSGVRECVVVARDHNGNKQLAGYVVAEPGSTLSVPAIRAELKQRLPDYMVPAALVFLEKLPLTPSGKVDRRSLPAPDEAQTSAPPIAPAERPWLPIQLQLVQLWEEMLGVRPIGIRDNFFELGGHSLLAVRMMDRVEELTGKKLPVTELFHDATVAHLADLILENEQRSSHSVVELRKQGERAPVYFLHGDLIGGGFYARDLARLVGAEHPFFVLPPTGMQDAALTTVEELATIHLRDLRKHRPHGPYVIGGFCIGALIAYEMAIRLTAEGEQVPWIALIDPQLPSKFLRAHYNFVQKLAAKRSYNDEEKLAKFAFGHKVLFRLREEWNAPLSEKMRFARRATGKLLHRHKGAPQPNGTPTTAAVGNGAFKDEEQRILAAFHWILSGYTPRPYKGAVTMFLTDEQHELTPFLEQRWGDAAASLQVERIPGKHLDSITTNIELLARKLDNHLRAACR
jgi:amino acid adenylation domain-containing protein